MKFIHEVVYAYYGIPYDNLFNRSRVKDFVTARQMFQFVAHERGYTLSEIARYSEVTHATVLNSIKRIKGFVETEKKTEKDFLLVLEISKEGANLKDIIEMLKDAPQYKLDKVLEVLTMD